MYADNTLTPREAIRLCALGTLASGPMGYDALVFAVRHFISRITGPSLELMGESIELLKFESLIEENAGGDGAPELSMTDQGRAVFLTLMRANLRAASGDINDLVMALKIRFIGKLPAKDQLGQAEILIEASESELARIEDLRDHHKADSPRLAEWLEIEVAMLADRLDWLMHLRAQITEEGDSSRHSA
ncbi:MAG: hypothetical protein HQ503_09500 [Rhodospirillales bacterium]|nr:hypothetical protein [Rhodospirillales bacterium]